MRQENGYRVYPESVVGRVLLVRRAVALGFTLGELARLLGERDRGGAPCHEVRALAGEKLAALRDELRQYGARVWTWGSRSRFWCGGRRCICRRFSGGGRAVGAVD